MANAILIINIIMCVNMCTVNITASNRNDAEDIWNRIAHKAKDILIYHGCTLMHAWFYLLFITSKRENISSSYAHNSEANHFGCFPRNIVVSMVVLSIIQFEITKWKQIMSVHIDNRSLARLLHMWQSVIHSNAQFMVCPFLGLSQTFDFTVKWNCLGDAVPN